MDTNNYWNTVFRRRMQRRRFMGTAAVAGAGLSAAALVGCGDDDDDDGGSNTDGTGTSTTDPGSSPDGSVQYGGSPTVVWETEPVGVFDPHVSASGFVLSNRSMVFNGFYWLEYPEIAEYQPEIVESREDPEPGTFIFKVRPGVQLHDESEEVNADLVKWNIERNLEQGKQYAGGFTASAKGLAVETVDPMTVKFTFDPPSVQNVETFVAIGYGMTSIVSRAQAEKLGDDFWQQPVGTGPFTLKEWISGTSITYEKWPNYFLKDASGNALPYVDGMTAIDLPDPTVRVLNLQSGQADLAPIQPSDVQTLEGDSNIEIVPSGPQRLQFTLNHNKPPFDNVHYRQALNWAIDRESLAEALYYGYAKPAGGIPENSQWYNPDFKQAGYDPERVRQELEAAGTPDGFKFSVAVLPAGVRRQAAELIQGQLREFGIEWEILPMESVDYVSRLYGTGELDGFFAVSLIPGTGEVSGFEGIRDSATRKDTKSYPELLALTDKIPSTFDREERKQLIWDAQEIYYNELAYGPVMVDAPQLYGLRKQWTNLGFVGSLGVIGNYAGYRGLRQA